MPLGVTNTQWLAQNRQRRYPLADDAGGADTSGSFHLPDSFLVSLDLPVHAGQSVDPGRFFVLHVGAYGNGYTVVVGYQPVAGDPVSVASALIPRQGFSTNTVYALNGGTDFEDAAGKLVIGELDEIDLQPPGFWTFDFEQTRLDPDAIRPNLRGVSSITCVNGDQESSPLYGAIRLVALNNFQLSVVEQAGQDPIIYLSAISGEGTIETCVCEGDAALSPPIRTILGIEPTAAGEFALVGSACISFEPIANGLRVVNTCAQPCCGCPELERITQDLERLKSEAASVREFAQQLTLAVQTMDTIVLSSRARDRGCSPP